MRSIFFLKHRTETGPSRKRTKLNSSFYASSKRNSAKWPARYEEEAAKYNGPWDEESDGIDDFMASVPLVLGTCETTHTHPKSVSIYV
jgi:hypothetical protein